MEKVRIRFWVVGPGRFYKEPYYDKCLTDYMNTQHRYPQPIMQTVTAPFVNLNVSAFTKPVGEYDFTSCGGYCPGILGPAARKAFPYSKRFKSSVQPGAAYNLNLAYNATGGYQVIVESLGQSVF